MGLVDTWSFKTLSHWAKIEKNYHIIRVGNPDEWCTQNSLPQDCLPVGISEGNRFDSPGWHWFETSGKAKSFEGVFGLAFSVHSLSKKHFGQRFEYSPLVSLDVMICSLHLSKGLKKIRGIIRKNYYCILYHPTTVAVSVMCIVMVVVLVTFDISTPLVLLGWGQASALLCASPVHWLFMLPAKW